MGKSNQRSIASIPCPPILPVNKPMEEKAFPTAGPLNSTLARQLLRAIKL